MFPTAALIVAALLPAQQSAGPQVNAPVPALNLNGPELLYTATRSRSRSNPAMVLRCEGDQVVIFLSGLPRNAQATVHLAIAGRNLSAAQSQDGTARLSMLAGPRTLDALNHQSVVSLRLAGRSYNLRQTDADLRQRFVRSCRMGFEAGLGAHNNLPPAVLVPSQQTLSIHKEPVDSPVHPR